MTNASFARASAVAALLIGGVALSACSSSHSSAQAGSPTSAATSQRSSASAPTTSSTVTSGQLTQAQFVTKADAVCASVDAQLNALPHPTSATDYATLAKDLTTTEQLFDHYIASVTPLVDQSPDAAALKSGWLAVEEKDFETGRPVLEKLVTALKAGDAPQIEALGKQSDALPDHTDQIIAVMKAHGLTGCATLEADTEGSSDA
jgi:hypothetical protein